MSTPLSGGYCGGVPPLPIPNREVKPTCADGTAMQCGRVGSCLFSYQRPWREISEVFFVLSGLSCCPCTDGTPCQIGQCRRVGSRLFSYEALWRFISSECFFCLPFTPQFVDGTPCQIGQCGRVGSCLFSYEALWRFISSECFFCLPSTPQSVRWYTLSNRTMRESR